MEKSAKVVNLSRILRKRMTPEEKHLWYDFLKKLPLTINRQKVIGNYIADFYCSAFKIIIELDGSQHDTRQGIYNDAIRDAELRQMGITILRFSNQRVQHDFDGVCHEIATYFNIEPTALKQEKQQ